MNIRFLRPLLALVAVSAFVVAPASAQLVLNVDRTTGATSIGNTTGADVEIDSYGIRSASGLANAVGWNSFDDQAISDWAEIGNLSVNQVGELSAQNSQNIADASNAAIGSAVFANNAAGYANAFSSVGFGVDVEDLVFEYTVASNPTSINKTVGEVVYTGGKRYNNLVLDINGASGNLLLSNESSESVTIDFYQITSASGQLDSGWNGLSDTDPIWQGPADGGNNDSDNQLSEFVPATDFTIPGGAIFDLGTGFDLAISSELDVEFEFRIVGRTDLFEGVVRGTNINVVNDNANFNGDTIVDATDFLTWQQGFGTGTTLAEGDANGDAAVDGADLSIWETQYGNVTTSTASVSAVPEPAAFALALLGLASCCSCRRRLVR